jgi:hypothetical protein
MIRIEIENIGGEVGLYNYRYRCFVGRELIAGGHFEGFDRRKPLNELLRRMVESIEGGGLSLNWPGKQEGE